MLTIKMISAILLFFSHFGANLSTLSIEIPSELRQEAYAGNNYSRAAFWGASKLSDPICKSHEYFRRIQIVDALYPEEWKVVRLARQFFLGTLFVYFGALGIITAPPSIALRALGIRLQATPFLYEKGNAPEKILPSKPSFSLLSWNICCVAGGYPVSDGGVLPWSDRIDALAEKIIETDADVTCLYETFDLQAAARLSDELKAAGYSHIYYNIGPKAMGPPSGIFVASKYRIANPEFISFPQELLIGRTKHASKGIFTFDLVSNGAAFATVAATHLQHSEQPEFPTSEEIQARAAQMEMLVERIKGVQTRAVLVVGDLNLDDQEFSSSAWSPLFEKNDQFSEKTWGGDAFCARLTGKEISGPLNLDHSMSLKGSVRSLETSLIDTGFDAEILSQGALTDHRGLLTQIHL